LLPRSLFMAAIWRSASLLTIRPIRCSDATAHHAMPSSAVGFMFPFRGILCGAMGREVFPPLIDAHRGRMLLKEWLSEIAPDIGRSRFHALRVVSGMFYRETLD